VRRLLAEPVLLALVGLSVVLDAVASIIRHVNLGSGLDLSFFDQAVWHYSKFQAPFSSILGKDLLGDHFHPLVAVLAPLYWIWSDPRMLLIAQAVLVAASIVPVFLFAKPRLGRVGAYLLAAAYAAFWGLQVGALYDFHELAFAPLLIALTIFFADRRRWGWFWLSVALVLLVKEDLSVYVVFLGVYLLTLREFPISRTVRATRTGPTRRSARICRMRFGPSFALPGASSPSHCRTRRSATPRWRCSCPSCS